ncbi:hypothetical protein KR032_002195 [Drosophila birchii]|nr:hypothetical protein KR032_002195 [Drosophila birchii]
MSKQVPCDYCGSSNDSKTIFSAQKSFVGHKMLDVLQIITHKDLPSNLGLKVCFMCASNLMTTMGVIEKTLKLVNTASLTKTATKNKKAVIKTEEADKSIVSPIIDLTPEDEEKSAEQKTTPVAKNKTLRQRSKSMAVRPSDLIFPKSPIKKLDEHNASPAKKLGELNASPAKKLGELNASPSNKTPKKQASRLEDSLDDSVKLTPAKEIAPNKKVFLQLFGSRNTEDASPESEDEDEDENAAAENADKVIAVKKDFDCKLCDFQSRSAKLFKDHLSKEHGQQRPRIYFCDMCPKSFGILKSWRVHSETVHGVTVEAPQKEAKAKVAKPKEQQKKDYKEDEVKPIEKSPRKEKSKKANEKTEAREALNETDEGPQLATIKALNGEAAAKKKWLDKVISNPDYTFDINGSSASTPKAADISIELSNEFKCDICDSELATVKLMQDHMKTAHGIDKPKIFKCPVCDKGLTTKQSLKLHMNLHTEGAEAEKSSKRKILQEEKDVDMADGIADNSRSEEDDEKPQEEKISHTDINESKTSTQISIDTADESGTMAPPKAPGKKTKKAKSSSSPNTPQKVVDISDSPSKKAKRKIKDEPSLNETTTVVDLLDEINVNVKPHKKARLQSASDSFCSSIDDYSTAEESPFTCTHCGKQVKSKQRLIVHIQKRHGTKLECPGCKTSYSNQRDYVNHFAVCSSGGSLLPCCVGNCKKAFIEADYLASHLAAKHQWT